MVFGIASISCFGVLVYLLADRGGTDWSRSYAYFWWLLWATAVALAIAAVLRSLRPELRTSARVTGLVTGLATLALSALLFLFTLSAASAVS